MRSIPARLGIIALILIILTTTVLPQTLASSLYSPMPPGDFKLTASDHFDIYSDSTRISDDDVMNVILYSNLAFSNVTAFFGDYDYRNRIILASNHDQYSNLLYNYLTNENISESEVASDYGDAGRGTIVIEAPDQLPDFEARLTHELAQIVLRTKLISNKYNIPEWFSDGLATYIAGGPSDSDKTLVEAACRDGKMMTATQMQEAYGHASDASASAAETRLAYAQSGMLIQYIAEKYGEDSLRLIIQDYGTSADLDKSFLRRIGYAPDGICADWQNSLKGELTVKDGVVPSGSIKGYVTDAGGKPLANRSIIFTCTRNDSAAFGMVYSAMTDNSGFYKVNLTYGPFDVKLDRQGYKPMADSITLQKSEALIYNITLVKADEVTVTPSATSAANQNVAISPEATNNSTIYIVLGVVNVLAILLIAFVFLRVKK